MQHPAFAHQLPYKSHPSNQQPQESWPARRYLSEHALVVPIAQAALQQYDVALCRPHIVIKVCLDTNVWSSSIKWYTTIAPMQVECPRSSIGKSKQGICNPECSSHCVAEVGTTTTVSEEQHASSTSSLLHMHMFQQATPSMECAYASLWLCCVASVLSIIQCCDYLSKACHLSIAKLAGTA